MTIESIKPIVKMALTVFRAALDEGADPKEAVRMAQAFMAACMISGGPDKQSGEQ